MMRMTLRVKLILSQILPILILLPFFGFFLLSTLHAFYLDHLRGDLLQTGALLTDAVQNDPALADDNSRLQELLRRAGTQTPTRIQIIDRNGMILASTEPEDAPLIGTTSQEKAVRSALAGKESYETGANDVVTVAVPVTSAGRIGAIRLSLQMSDIGIAFTHLDELVIIGSFVLTLLSLVIAYILGSTLSRSLRHLANETNFIAKGDYSHHVQVNGDDEVAELARRFNEMADQLTEQRAARQRLLDNIAHELRQPLSAIRTAVEVLQGSVQETHEPIKRLHEGIKSEMDRLGQLTQHLEFMALDEYLPVSINKTPVEVTETIDRVVALFESEAQRLGIKLVSKLPETLPPVMADEAALVEVFTNLVGNALKYTPAGGQVCVSAGATQDQIWVCVVDTGMGLTAEEQKQLFKRFYRGDVTRSRPKGIGLGLAIAHELVQAHGGTIQVSSKPEQGATFLVELPR
jgi:signal transduction histidine kinase